MSETVSAGSSTRQRSLPLVLLGLVLALIVADGTVALLAIKELREASTRSQNSMAVRAVLKDIEDCLEEGSRSHRMYRLFGDPRELDEFRVKRAALPPLLLQARGLLAADRRHADALHRLEALIEEDNKALASSLTTATPLVGSGSVPAEFVAAFARNDAIVEMLNTMLVDETGLIDERFSVIASRDMIVQVTVVLGTVGSIVLIGVIFAMLRRNLRQSERLALSSSGALQESEQRFRRIFEDSPVGIVLVEQELARIVQANPAFCQTLGSDADHVIGRTIVDLAHVDDRDLLRDVVQRAKASKEGIEIRYVTGAGAVAWASMRLTPLTGAGGRKGLLLALVENITQHKRVEAELRQAQKMEAIGQLTGGMAHDFNNLLGVIIGNAEFLIDCADDAMQADLAKEILNSALGGADLTRRMLAFARRQPLQPQQIDLNAYLPDHVVVLRRLLGETISLTTSLASDLWLTRADPSQVGDALLNLAINARDAMPRGGRITIETANAHLQPDPADDEVTPGDYVMLSMRDTGIGMPPAVLERAMEPFFTTKGPGAGSGLGLSMIFGFARQSGGHLRIESEVGQGTVVRLYLPRAPEPGATETSGPDEGSAPRGCETILLVDDNPGMRTVAQRHLSALGYAVTEANSGPSALAILQAGSRFDLLFTDLIMPDGMTGHELAAIAQRLQPNLRVLFTTGYARTDQEGELSGTVIHKPYRRQDLAETIRATLDA